MNEQPTLALATRSQSVRQSWADWAGMFASVGCAVHCAAMPLVFAYLPTFGLGWMTESGFHQWMTMVCFLLAIAAFMPGWQKHRSVVPAIWGTAGIALLALGAFGMEGYCCPVNPDGSVASGESLDPSCKICTVDEVQAIPATTLNTLLMPIAHLITPLGGVLLIVGHVTNHRKSCACECHECGS